MESITVLWMLAWLFILGGLLGTFLPFLPGISLMFAGMVIIGWLDDFQKIGFGTLAILLILTVLAHIIDYAASVIGAKKMGASKGAIWGSVMGSVVGVFFGFVGIFFLPFVGAVMGQLMTQWDMEKATKVGIGTWLGLIVGMALKIAIAFMMLGILAFSYILASAS